MRRGEILAMRWNHLQESHRVLVVPISKNGQPRVIPLSRPTLELLNGVPRTSERVFPITSNAFVAGCGWSADRQGCLYGA
jgi:integrase